MTLSELQDWLPFLQDAPENIRDKLLGLFWFLVFLSLVALILKLIFSKNFMKSYKILANSIKSLLSALNIITNSLMKSLELPTSHPRLTKFFSIFFMFNTYAAFLLFTVFFLLSAVVVIYFDALSFYQNITGLLFTIVLGYCAWFCFAQAEHERVKIFK